jgi:hypothetical protein
VKSLLILLQILFFDSFFLNNLKKSSHKMFFPQIRRFSFSSGFPSHKMFSPQIRCASFSSGFPSHKMFFPQIRRASFSSGFLMMMIWPGLYYGYKRNEEYGCRTKVVPMKKHEWEHRISEECIAKSELDTFEDENAPAGTNKASRGRVMEDWGDGWGRNQQSKLKQ